MADTLTIIKQRIQQKTFTQHVVVNVAKLINVQKDDRLKQSVESCDLINIDGMGVVWGARFLGYDIPERVAGVDLFYHLLKMAEQENFSVFLLGGTQEVIKKTTETVKKKHPSLNVVGSHHGYFWDDEASIVEKIKASGAQLLFVAITSPKKENFIDQWQEALGVDFVMGVGGTFDVVAGKVSRAPLWMQQWGLEWLYRVLQEPGRMWKRYLVTNTLFATLIVTERLRQRPWKTRCRR
ncbi:WecB/TagA/CpsF family glycosyltransferase [Candidatus Sororendozoicomonas aggregata]|uniref:WecB/TagA/CpsF family glycosyltransferase n=1 Tax=Candidatus Sororendozoicomonas aggregata TaxID=3073239 RepID=UPI002ED46C7B